MVASNYTLEMPYKDRTKQLEYLKKHYEDNKDAYYKRSKDRRIKLREQVQDLKESMPCMDCGIFYPYFALEFDHILGKKVMGINSIVKRRGINTVLEEISKCEVVCRNCHAFRTQKRMKSSILAD